MDSKGSSQVPLPRSGHVSVIVGKYLLVWGGYTGYVPQENVDFDESERYLNPEIVWAYHTDIKQWLVIRTKGDHPLGTSGACAVAVDDAVYLVGGHTDLGNSNALHKLNLKNVTWEWIRMDSDEVTYSPRDKFSAWDHNDRLYIFGGYGMPDHYYLRGNGKYMDDPSTYSHRGWNNQLFYYKLNENERRWHNPKCKGQVPSPRAAQAVDKVNDQLYMFGGRHSDSRLNDLHVLDLPSLTWTQILIDSDLPPGRSWHSFTPMSDTSLFLYGGYTQDGKPLSDAWVLNTEKMKWRKLRVAQNKTRLWHTSCLSKDGTVLIYGGCCNDILSQDERNEHTSEILEFRLSPKSLLNISIERVYDYRDQLRPEWDTLPRSLTEQLLLKERGIHPDVSPVDQSPSDTIGFTCSVS